MKREQKQDNFLEHVRQRIDISATGTLTINDANFILLEKISDQLDQQNQLLRQLVEKESAEPMVTVPNLPQATITKKKRWLFR